MSTGKWLCRLEECACGGGRALKGKKGTEMDPLKDAEQLGISGISLEMSGTIKERGRAGLEKINHITRGGGRGKRRERII